MKIVKLIKDKALSASIAAYQLRGTVAKSLVVLPLALLSKEAAAETTVWEKINTFTEGLASTQPGLITGGKVIGVVFFIVGACLVGLTAWISSVGSTVGVDATL